MLDLRTARKSSVAGPLLGWATLVLVAVVWGAALSETHHQLVLAAPPFWSPLHVHPTWRLLPPIVVASFVVGLAPRAARSLSWPALLGVTALSSALWSCSVALVDSIRGINALTDPLRPARNDYLQSARGAASLHEFLVHFVARISAYPQNTKGHPPGMVVIEWLLDRVGLAGAGWSATLSVAGGVAAALAALVALREVAGEHAARAAAPFMVLVPAVIWWQTADAFFAGVGAWSVTALVLASGARGRRAVVLAVAGGLGFGITAFLSYGLVLLALIPIVVCIARRATRLLMWAAVGALPVFAAFGLLGFSWFAGLAATRHEYWTGVAIRRPYSYFLFADLALFAVATGPAVAVALGRLHDRRTWLLVGGALAIVALADLSGMSKAEVERIWLPFVPWVLLATAALADLRPSTRIRPWLALQAGCTLVVATTIWSQW